MSNFRLNLPVDVPWKLIDSSPDMMDVTFCNQKYPSPFKSSIAIYAYEPKIDELPEELCGDHITYLKVSCTITGYQPSEAEKGQIVSLFEAGEVDYEKMEQIISEYLGCYGVLLNVSVHPFSDELKDDLDKYPRIVDFEPKTRDFYQAASETGEILSGSISRVSTNKSFGSTESTQSSWQAGANSSISPEGMMQMTGIPVGIGANGTVGQVRTDTDQQNWSVGTDASRERRENHSTTTQLSQMYNLLTGYHTGSNRAAFIMLPRPHVLQPTDRRTFVQGLRVIEGVQDFFLVVVRPADQDKMKVDAFLQTGHFPEDINIESPSDEAKYEFHNFLVPVERSINGEGRNPLLGNKKKDILVTLDVVDEANSWEADPTKGDSGRGGVKQIRNQTTVTITEFDSETGQVLGSHEETVDTESGSISDVDYKIEDGKLVVTAHLEATPDWGPGGYGITRFSRLYRVYIRRLKINAPTPVADIAGMLITQRSLCVQIEFGDCIKKIPIKNLDEDQGIVIEPPFSLDDYYDLPYGSGLNTDKLPGVIQPKGPRFDFAFKKAIIRKIQQTLITTTTSPLRNKPGEVGYLQSRHFRRRLLSVLPDKFLDSPISSIDFIDHAIKNSVDVSLRDFLSKSDSKLATATKLTIKEVSELRKTLFKSRGRES